MGDSNDLKEFIKSWKSELSTRKSTSILASNEGSVSGFQAGCSKVTSRSNQDESIKEISNNISENQSTDKVAVPTSSQSDIVYGPFGVIGQLFHRDTDQVGGGQSCVQMKIEPSSGSSDQCNKNKRKSSNFVSRSKKWKQRDIKDIFVDKNVSVQPSERLLDRLIADIDEITEIPFFDISVPREVAIKIFQCLSLADLCNCAQVSLGWRNLAEDEWLWCRICHRLGQVKIYATKGKTNWKDIVKHNIERQRLLVTNWKGRVGKLSQLDHSKGKILCAVDNFVDRVAAGYSNGEVKLWDLSNGDTCVFQPSDTSLTLSNHGDGQVSNIVKKVVVSEHLTAAAYTHGNVDVWSLEAGTKPLYTHTIKFKQLPIDNLCMSRTSMTFALSYGSYIDVLHKERETEDFTCKAKYHVNNGTSVLKLQFLDTKDTVLPPVVIGKQNVVNIYCPRQHEGHLTEIHNLSDADLQAMDVRTDPDLIAVGLRSYFGVQCGYRVRLYDAVQGRLKQTLRGTASTLSVINLHDSPVNKMAAAAGDSGYRVFIYDLRQEDPVMSLPGNQCRVTTLQMDDWKLVAGRIDGFVCVWDQRMATKLWEWHNRHPVRYCRFIDKTLVTGNIADDKFPLTDQFEYATHRRYRGSVQVYDFLSDQMAKGLPEICLSSYDQPDASKYNIGLAMPYDTLAY